MSKEKNIPGNVQEDQRDRKMSKGELVSYGLGGVASTMPSQFKTAYAMNFMSDVAGLHVGAVGILNTLLIIWDAINDPIIGGIADRTNTKRWGKYRPPYDHGYPFMGCDHGHAVYCPGSSGDRNVDLLYCGAAPVFGFLYPVYGSVAGIGQRHDPGSTGTESDAHLPSVRRLHRRSRCGRDYHSHCPEIGRIPGLDGSSAWGSSVSP